MYFIPKTCQLLSVGSVISTQHSRKLQRWTLAMALALDGTLCPWGSCCLLMAAALVPGLVPSKAAALHSCTGCLCLVSPVRNLPWDWSPAAPAAAIPAQFPVQSRESRCPWAPWCPGKGTLGLGLGKSPGSPRARVLQPWHHRGSTAACLARQGTEPGTCLLLLFGLPHTQGFARTSSPFSEVVVEVPPLLSLK